MNREKAVPENWFEYLDNRCDLDMAFKVLEDLNHFHTDTLRGRIRSLQLRPKEAWEFFQRAEERAHEFEESEQNQLRLYYRKIFCFENALIEESVPSSGDTTRMDMCLLALNLDDFPYTELAYQITLLCHEMYFIHKEKYEEALDIFTQYLDESKGSYRDHKACFYICASAAYREMGKYEESEKQLENACLCIPSLKFKFNMALYASMLISLFHLRGRNKDAEEWKEFIEHLNIPQKTAWIFLERTRRIIERSNSLNRVFIF